MKDLVFSDISFHYLYFSFAFYWFKYLFSDFYLLF